MIIAITGHKRAGKTTLASMIQVQLLNILNGNGVYTKNERKYWHILKNLEDNIRYPTGFNARYPNIRGSYVEISSFARPLKEVLCTLLGITSPSLLDELKMAENGLKLANKEGRIYTIRELLQLIGTDALRNVVDPEIWIKHMNKRSKFDPKGVTIIPDVRLQNEIEFLAKKAKETNQVLLTIELTNTNTDTTDSHISEAGIDHDLLVKLSDILLTINNDKSLEELLNLSGTICETHILANLKSK